METPVVTPQQVHEAIDQLPAEMLPEVAEFIEFVKYRMQQRPHGGQLNKAESEQHALRIALIKAARGRFAHVLSSSEEFARRKQEDIDLEDHVK